MAAARVRLQDCICTNSATLNKKSGLAYSIKEAFLQILLLMVYSEIS